MISLFRTGSLVLLVYCSTTLAMHVKNPPSLRELAFAAIQQIKTPRPAPKEVACEYTATLKRCNPTPEKELFDGDDWFTDSNRTQKYLDAVYNDKKAWIKK